MRSSSKLVLPGADGGEYFRRIGDAAAEILVRRLDHRRLAAAQKRIGGLLVAEGAWQRRLSGFAQAAVASLARGEGRVAGLDGLRETDVGQRVFVTAVDLRVVGQRAQFFER